MLLVKDFLLKYTLQDLINFHGVYPKFSLDNHKMTLDYSQIEANTSDKLANQCRGLILRRKDKQPFKNCLNSIIGETEILAYPFDRFLNYNSSETILNKNLKVYEKLDGTLIILYFDYVKNEWHTATRSVSEANIPINGSDLTFRGLFELALQQSYNINFIDFTKDLNKQYTYMLELTSIYNRVVVDYKKPNITLLGARDNISLSEIDIDNVKIHVDKVSQYEFSSINQIIDLVESFNPLQHEGVVVCDDNFYRVKIKSSAYVALHHTIDSISCSDRNLLKLILLSKDDDVLFDIPEELAIKLMDLKSKLIGLAKNIEFNFNYLKIKSNNDINHRKEFALLLKKFNIKFQGCYWYLFDNEGKGFFDFISSKKDYTNSFLDMILENL